MNVGFKITFADGSVMKSHDDKWKQVKDHAHALAPHNDKQWLSYELYSDTGVSIIVNFDTGTFNINGNIINPADQQSEALMTHKEEPQEFPVSESWQILNGLNYFPVVGRRQMMGWFGQDTWYFAGWKRKFKERTVQKLVFLTARGEIILT
jgi:hypothetical protein